MLGRSDVEARSASELTIPNQQDPGGVHDGLVRRLNDVLDWFATNVRPQIHSDINVLEKTTSLRWRPRASGSSVGRRFPASSERHR